MKKRLPNLDDNYIGLRISDGAGAFIAGFAFLYIFQIAIIVIAGLAGETIEACKPMAIWLMYVTMVINQAALVVAVWVYGLVSNKPIIRTCRLKKKLSPIQVLILPLIAVFSILAFLPIAEGFVMLVELITGKPVVSNINIGTEWWQIILSIFFIAVLPAIGEEILFRGAVARGLKRKSYVFGILMSAFLFSIFHGSAAQTVHQFLIGIVFAYVYFVSGSLLASMVVHFCNNALAIAFDSIMTQAINPEVGASLSGGALAGIYVAMSIVGIIGLYFLMRWFMAESKKVAHIVDVDKDKYAFFKDPIRIFTREGYAKFNATLADLFADSDDKVDINKDINEVDASMVNEDLRGLLEQHNKNTLHKRKRYDMIVLGIAIAICSSVWILNLIISPACPIA